MQERERDARSNSYMQEASKVLGKSKALLKEKEYDRAMQFGRESMLLAMRSVLALDDMIGEEDEKIPEVFRKMYLKTEAMSPEWETLLDRMAERAVPPDEQPGQISKEEAGRLISQLQFFLQEIVDYLVQRNAMYWG